MSLVYAADEYFLAPISRQPRKGLEEPEMTSDPAPSILFVCLGNICRSPLAEAALRAAAAKAGIAMVIDSAGTGDWHAGDPPDRRAQAVARRHGIDISQLRARQVEEADFHSFDRIFALDQNNLAALRAIAPPNARAELSMLMSLVSGCEGDDVHDPYYGNESGFEVAWEDVSAAASALVTTYANKPERSSRNAR
jgi:protein-tyrosine phosphatase